MLVGAINTVFNYSLFAMLVLALGTRIPYLILLLVSHVVSVVEAYVLQRRFVFRVQGRWFRDLARFWSVYLVALGVNVVVLPVLVEVLNLPVLLAQGLFLGFMTLGTFLAHTHFTFRRTTL